MPEWEERITAAEQKGETNLKRLKKILLDMDADTASYGEMYRGRIIIRGSDGSRPSLPEEEPIYYQNDIGYEITVSHRMAKDKPTITVMIPRHMIFSGKEADDTCREAMDKKSGICQETPQESVGWGEPLHAAGKITGKCDAAAADFCLRKFKEYMEELNAELYNKNRSEKENGKYCLCDCGSEVLVRNAAYFALCPQKDYENGSGAAVYPYNDGIPRLPRMCLCLKLQVQLPKGRLRKTIQMLCKDLPDAVERFVAELDHDGLNRALGLAKKQAAIRAWLKQSQYIAFIADGSVLPRQGGTDLPMPGAVPFRSTPQDAVEICGVRGMGIKREVTVITGGGYSGKSTLLNAIASGIYDHIPGDGRELCITDETAVTISAEDGRSVRHINISPFIRWMQDGDTRDFSTEHASGSTSQAANVMEAVDGGAKLLLIDEDRSAANFMIRDRMMKELIAKEPIIPFTDRAGELARELGVSTILVIGGSGEYLLAADKVFLMEDYMIRNVTEESKRICRKYEMEAPRSPKAWWGQDRVWYEEGFTPYPEGKGSEELMVSDMGFLVIGDEKIDVRGMHDIVSPCQRNALGFMLRYLEVRNDSREIDLQGRLEELYERIAEEGLDFLYSSFFTTCDRFLALPRRQELLALLNRMRRVHVETRLGLPSR